MCVFKIYICSYTNYRYTYLFYDSIRLKIYKSIIVKNKINTLSNFLCVFLNSRGPLVEYIYNKEWKPWNDAQWALSASPKALSCWMPPPRPERTPLFRRRICWLTVSIDLLYWLKIYLKVSNNYAWKYLKVEMRQRKRRPTQPALRAVSSRSSVPSSTCNSMRLSRQF